MISIATVLWGLYFMSTFHGLSHPQKLCTITKHGLKNSERSCIHVYNGIHEVAGEDSLNVSAREPRNAHDRYTVAVEKNSIVKDDVMCLCYVA